MIIVNGEVKDYIVLDSKYVATTYSSFDDWIGLTPVLNQGTQDFGVLQIELWVSESTKEDYIRKLSELASVFKRCTIQLSPNLIYECNRNGQINESLVTPTKARITITFKCYLRGDVNVIENVVNGSKVIVGGNMDTYALYEIVPLTDAASIKIAGITIKNIKKGKNIILGEGKILEDGKSKLSDTDLIKFPRLKAGENIIEITGNVKVKLSYSDKYN